MDAVGRVDGVGRMAAKNGSGDRTNIGIGVWRCGDCGICRSQVEWCKGMDGVVTVRYS